MAITERYVRADAAGGGDGTTDANSGATGAFTWGEMITDINTPRVGYRYNVKQGTYSLSATTTITGDGTTTSPNIIRGYKDTPGDATLGRGANGLIDTSNMPTISYTSSSYNFSASGANYLIVESLIIEGNTGSSMALVSGTGSCIFNCVVNQNTTSVGDGIENGSSSMILGCDVYLPNGSSSAAEALSTLGPTIANKVFMGANGTGINLRNNPNLIAFNTVVGGNVGINKNTAGQTALVLFNTVADASGDGIDFAGASTARVIIIGNHVTGCGGYGIDFNSSTCDKYVYANRFRDNTSGNMSATDDWSGSTNVFQVDTAGSDSVDFTSVASLDYSLKSTAPAYQKALFAHYMNIGGNGTPAGASAGTRATPFVG